MKSLKKSTLAFIGAGNIATSMIVGLIKEGVSPSRIWATCRSKDKLDALSEHVGVTVTMDNAEAAAQSDVVILAVKPVDMAEAMRSIKPVIQSRNPIVISLAAGVLCKKMRLSLGSGVRLVRGMPNIAAMIQQSATGLYAVQSVDQPSRDLVESTMRSVGSVVWLDKEEDLDTVTALSGSGPAYFLCVMQALQKAAERLGLEEETAKQLILQTAFGAAGMVLSRSGDLAGLIEKVTSPGGTTAAALEVLEKRKMEDMFLEVVEAARKRAVNISASA